jgi:hypothetical protein
VKLDTHRHLVPRLRKYGAVPPLPHTYSWRSAKLSRILRGPFEKFVDSPYYSESELCGDAVTVSFSKYLPWQAMKFIQRSTHFSKTCCRPFAACFKRIVEQAGLTFYALFSVSKALPPLENRSSSHCIVSIGLMDEL